MYPMEFPNLANSGYTVTSPKDPRYNCIAWAANEDNTLWWPDTNKQAFWPPGVAREATIDAFIAAYMTIGYETCGDGNFEKGYEKIAIYASVDGTPTHAARQLDSRKWTSKLGLQEDLEHSLEGLEGPEYGMVSLYMERKK